MGVVSEQRNDKQNPPLLLHAIARSSCSNLHGTLIYSAQFLHRQIISIFTVQYQHHTKLRSSVQNCGGKPTWCGSNTMLK